MSTLQCTNRETISNETVLQLDETFIKKTMSQNHILL